MINLGFGLPPGFSRDWPPARPVLVHDFDLSPDHFQNTSHDSPILVENSFVLEGVIAGIDHNGRIRRRQYSDGIDGDHLDRSDPHIGRKAFHEGGSVNRIARGPDELVPRAKVFFREAGPRVDALLTP